jgi:hypothetical protein
MTRTKPYILLVLLTLINWSYETYAQSQFSVEKAQFSHQEYDESSPAYFKDGIVFCANRKNDFLVSYSDSTGDKLFDLYFSKPIPNGKKWEGIEPLNNGLNSLINEGPSCFFNESNNVAVTRNIYTSTKFGNYLKSGNFLGIYFADVYDNNWTNIQPFEHNSTTYNVMHPALTQDGKTMYFASDMPGGNGGFDIYKTELKNGRWSTPVNIGTNINTDKNDAFPFIHKSGRLFFASKGWNSKGGFDIFYSQELEGNWIKPQSMKEQFNTNSDDFGLVADESLQSGYFTSNRSKSDDIYTFKSTITEFEECKPQQKNNFCYVFFENGTSESDVNGTMRYEWDLGDGTKIRALQAEHCFANIGKYIIQLNVIDTLTGELLLNQSKYEFEVAEIEQPYITMPDASFEGDTITLDAKKSNLKDFKIAKYYWDYDDGAKGIGQSVSHAFYQEGLYDVKLQLESTVNRLGISRKICVYKSIAIKKKQ